ncbi:DUF7716 domain-containing protein [Paracoccus zhejiangensis]|uniref:DUF7716 domain-containing protein n=1 Tax=Paracoccus zhejiangensis TaxID=1077935 RepID=A0A2H5EZ90_9RHOB|nr:hypothetical protein [Paracoccus zhejiangensis]AUH64615.1 hypothetical protein CX676_10925 [Paracoccus zhejiangensis]
MIISEVLADPTAYLWKDALFAEPVKPLTAETPCMVHDPNDVEDDELDLPNAVVEAGFDYVIAMQTVQSIVENARLQGRGDSLEDRLRALNFYLENDAFITF